MGGTFRVGRVAGVEVRVHWSVLVIFVLIATGLSVGSFPQAYPGYSGAAYALAGLVAAVAFLGGLLAHEVSHAVVARRNGIEVEDITLWLFGGVAQLHGDPRDPGAELRVAGVGPLVSLLLGLGTGVLAVGLAAAGVSGLPIGTLAWLSGINVLLAVFNVIPAAPLDGGRLLRAALWKWKGDRRWASLVAARAGRVLGFVLIALGLAQFLVTGLIGALWLALIGWFVAGAATLEEQRTTIDDVLAAVRVRDVMSAEPETVPSTLTVAELVELMATRRHSTFPLVDGGWLVGLVTLGRIKGLPTSRWDTTRLREIACPLADVPVASPDDPVPALVERLNRSADGRALVMDGGRLVGVVSPSDLARAIEHASLRSQAAGYGGRR